MSEATRERIRIVWPEIIDAIAQGEEIRKALAKFLVSYDLARAFLADEPNARKEWDQAKTDSADAYFDRVVIIANDPGSDPHRARVQADLFRWLAGKRNPREYSDKATLDVNVRTVDLTQIITAAQARLEASRVANAALLPAIEGVARRVLAGEQEASD